MRYFRIFVNILSRFSYILLILRMLTFYEMPFSPWFCQGSGAGCLTLWGRRSGRCFTDVCLSDNGGARQPFFYFHGIVLLYNKVWVE